MATSATVTKVAVYRLASDDIHFSRYLQSLSVSDGRWMVEYDILLPVNLLQCHFMIDQVSSVRMFMPTLYLLK